MTRAEFKAFVRSAIEALSPQVQFGVGRISEFNTQRQNQYPVTFLESPSVGTTVLPSTLPYDVWVITLHIGKKDAQDSSIEQYEGLIDDCDYLAQQIINEMNKLVDGYKNIELKELNRTPFIKDHADVITGVILTGTLTAPDKTSLC